MAKHYSLEMAAVNGTCWSTQLTIQKRKAKSSSLTVKIILIEDCAQTEVAV